MTTPSPMQLEPSGIPALNLCLYRLHGRRVDSSGVRIPSEGLVLGADSLAMAGLAAHYSTLHVAPKHAIVRANAGHWELEPGCREMVVALNGEPVPWGGSRLLSPGDRIDMGFASLLVETATAHEPEPAPSPEPAKTQSLLEIADIHAVLDFPDFPEIGAGPHSTSTELADISQDRCTGISQDRCTGISQDRCTGISQARRPGIPQDRCTGIPQDRCTGIPQDRCTGIPQDRCTGIPQDRCTGISQARCTGIPQARRTGIPQDPLAALAAESARVLAGKTPTLENCLPPFSPLPTPKPELPQDFTDSPETGELSGLSSAASLEEILEGPLTIDDVLDSLKRAHPEAEPRADSDPIAILTVPEPVPEPLLLLAGMAAPTVREPELAPVLHREHRATGITSPYRFTAHNDHSNEDSPKESQKEAPWPHPTR